MNKNNETRTPSALGRSIRRHRGAETQEDFAQALGVSQSLVSQWEHGRIDLSVSNVEAIERHLRLEAGTLFVEAGLVASPLLGREGELHIWAVRLEVAADLLVDAAVRLREGKVEGGDDVGR